ncbi:fasciclin domain-containing protein [Gordonia sp. NPDC003376]
MANRTRKSLALSVIAAGAVIGLAACSSEDTTTSAESTSTASEMTSTSSMATSTIPSATELVGPGCAAYAQQVPTGPGSVAELRDQPVATAAGNVPVLTSLSAALSGQLNPNVNLVSTLNGGQFTVLAPVDEAFAKVDAATMEKLKTDSDLLTSVLTYHVIPGQIAPADIAGDQTTVEGAKVTVTGSGDNLKFNDAGLVCGGIKTQNATVYLIDGVLLPPQ